MIAYKQYITIEDPKRVVLSDLPFRTGQRVEVLLIAEDDGSATNLEALQVLLKDTQGLKEVQTISENEIAQEIAHRPVERLLPGLKLPIRSHERSPTRYCRDDHQCGDHPLSHKRCLPRFARNSHLSALPQEKPASAGRKLVLNFLDAPI